MQSDVFYPIKTEILYQLKDVTFAEKAEILTLALQTNDVKVRQAVAEFAGEIPLSFQSTYETLLDDASYDTREIAFMTLWKTFPENQAKFLEKAKYWIGGNDKSLRILYLTFALLSADNQNNESLYAELVSYTAPTFESSVRQNAITNALSINPKDTTVLKNLVNTTLHHKWQFSKFGRDKIRQLIKKEGYADLFQSILPSLSESEVIQLQKLLSEKS